MMKEKQYFDELILNSLILSDSKIKKYLIPDSVYFNLQYLKSLKDELIKAVLYKQFARELQETRRGNGKIKMCSVASSSRLCFLNFQPQKYQMEYDLSTGNKNIKAHLDAFNREDTYFECKCHEIFDMHEPLKASYSKKLKEVFDINCRIEEDNLILRLNNFNIDDNRLISYLRFDMKQFICHLLGMANNGGGKLQYIFFTPSKRLIEQACWCKEIYNELDKELSKIWNSNVITQMCKQNRISLLPPYKIEVQKIKDFVLEKLE